MSYLNLKPIEFGAMGAKRQATFDWAGRILLPKYDGCFAMVGFWNGVAHNIWSRTGELVKSMDHVHEDLLVKYPWIADTKGGFMVLGEAWNPGSEFAELSGIFRRQYAQPQLGFAPFDTVYYNRDGPKPMLFSTDTYQDRLANLEGGRHVAVNIYAPVPVVCEDEVHAVRYAKNLKDLGGYDGAICSDPYASYTPGAGKGGEFIKLKPLSSYSLEVTGLLVDEGEKTGRVTGALQVRFKGGTCGVGTGFSNEAMVGWATGREPIIGKIIEVEAMGVSSKGLLREPRFKGIRHDVTTPDY
jgi:ATP-dependent DNA ligase